MTRILAFPGVDITDRQAALRDSELLDIAIRMTRMSAGLEFFRRLVAAGSNDQAFLDRLCWSMWGSAYDDCLAAYEKAVSGGQE